MTAPLIAADGRPSTAIAIVPLADLPSCWRKGWCSEECKAQALAALTRAQVMTPMPAGFVFPTPGGN